jgi:hypothetical protein
MRVNRIPQAPSSLAMHNTQATDVPSLALCKIIVQQPRDFLRLEGMQVQFTRDGNLDRLVRPLGGHGEMLAHGQLRATKNPPLAGRVFDTHTLTKNTLNN